MTVPEVKHQPSEENEFIYLYWVKRTGPLTLFPVPTVFP